MPEKAKPGAVERRGGRPNRKAKMEELEREVKELRGRLELDGGLDVTLWEQFNPQDVRDALAARALIAEWGNPTNALIRLGIEATGEHGRFDALAKRIFDTPGVRAILAKNLSEIEERKKDILARQVQIALYGDDDASVRAASQLAKVAGWQKTPDVAIQNNTLNLFKLVGGDKNTRAAALEAASDVTVGFLEHEPGDPVRIDSGDDAIEAAFQQVEE